MADLDRLLREQNPEPGQPRVPVPQYQKVDGVGFERVTGRHGGAHSVLLGPDGQPISSDNRLPVEVAGEVGITGGSIGVTGNVGITGGAASNLQIIADNQGRLYGRTASGSWLPVRVNSSGQLELAQNVVIDNVTVNVGAEVKINNDESEPVPVQLSGDIGEVELLKEFESVSMANLVGTGRRFGENGPQPLSVFQPLDVRKHNELLVFVRSHSSSTREWTLILEAYNKLTPNINLAENRILVGEPQKLAAGASYSFTIQNSPVLQARGLLTIGLFVGYTSEPQEGDVITVQFFGRRVRQ